MNKLLASLQIFLQYAFLNIALDEVAEIIL